MSDEPKSFEPVDLNRAPLDALVRLPGIGPALAQRIIEARPFLTPDDLVRVSGIGPVLLERLRPYLTVSAVESAVQDIPEASGTTVAPEEPSAEGPVESLASAVESTGELGSGEASLSESQPRVKVSSMPEEAPVAEVQGMTPPTEVTDATPMPEGGTEKATPVTEVAVPTSPASPAEKLLTRRDLITWVVGSNLVTLFLAVVLALLFLGVINGTLRYISLAQFRQFRAEVILLAERVDRLERNLDTMTARVQALEGLSTRVAGLEDETATLSDALEQAREDIQAIQTLVKGFDQRLNAVEVASTRFERFLSGLRRLLLETTTGSEEAP
ncbi:MAG: helix-hairpin-helix domain-containing protein [Thermanaerothrix sp.]|nr:helix-hairpin-helix domain-containing protein [Thermanaerothrix sp.]